MGLLFDRLVNDSCSNKKPLFFWILDDKQQTSNGLHYIHEYAITTRTPPERDTSVFECEAIPQQDTLPP